MAFSLDDYNDVPARLAELRDKWPDARLQPLDHANPYRIEIIGNQTYVVYVAACYRTEDDRCPGVGTAWEPVPGLTPYTKNSEIQNAETSAWGRAIVAALIADAKKDVASQEDVRNRREEQNAEPPAQRVSRIPTPLVDKAKRDRIKELIAASEDADAVKAGWAAVPLPSLAKLTVDRLPAALEYLASVGIAVDELPAQTALVGCPHCGSEISAENMVVSWPDPESTDDPPHMIAGCAACAPFVTADEDAR